MIAASLAAWIACWSCTKASSGNCGPTRYRTMHDAARTPLRPEPAGLPAQALAELAGVGACLLLPQLPAWPWFVLPLAVGLALWISHRQLLLLGALSCGFGLAGLHAGITLSRQLPPSLEQHDVVVTGRVLDLPQYA